jgi:hypothetical protein
MPVFQIGVQEGKRGPVWGLIAVGGGRYKERVKEGEYSGNTVVILCTYVWNWKNETISEVSIGTDKGEFLIYL